MSDDPSLSRAYQLQSPGDSVRLYRAWADSYDTGFVVENDYILHQEVARHFTNLGGFGPVLDVGAGTGICGVALRDRGIEPVDGTDISEEMLEIARAKGAYRDLFAANLLEGLPLLEYPYQGAVSSGTFTHGHVGPEGIDPILAVLRDGARVVISVNAAHYAAAGFDAKLAELEPQISDLTLTDVPIYGPQGTGEHAQDRALLVAFRKGAR
ncbi:MAG: methyltransferase domain-containing protein [Pseudomonadota bacterium]